MVEVKSDRRTLTKLNICYKISSMLARLQSANQPDENRRPQWEDGAGLGLFCR
jgi:hypothetical protein